MTNWMKAGPIRLAVALLVASAGLVLAPSAAHAKPTASFTFAPTSPIAGEDVTFTFTGACDAQPPCRIQWKWTEAGGSSLGTQMGEGEEIVYAFNNAGTKSVVVKITNSGTTNNFATSTQVIVVAPAPPPPPLGVTVVPGNERVSVAWVEPASAGSADITGYTATASPGGAECTTTGLSCVVTGLTNQKAYTFKVVSKSPGGVSPPATSAKATPQPAATVKVKAKKHKSLLLVDVNPNKGKKAWVFHVERLRKTGSWKELDTYRTKGPRERLKIDLKKGTYRVVVHAKFNHRGVTSGSVRLKK